MLEPSAIESAVPLVQSLSEQGITLEVHADTPLSAIVRDAPLVGFDPAQSSYDVISAGLLDASRGESHAALMSQTVELVTESVRRTLDYTRNVVIPHVREVLALFEQRLEGIDMVPLPYDLRFNYLAEIYKTRAGVEFASRWENNPAVTVPAGLTLGAYSPQEIEELSQLTEDDGFNSSLKELLSAQGGKGFQQIAEVLSGRMTIGQMLPEFSLPLAIVLRNIEMPKQGVSISLTAYNDARSILSNAAGKTALGLINNLSIALKNKILYKGNFIREVGTIDLVGEVYKLLLDDGLTSEAVIGNELLGRKYVGSQMLAPEVLNDLIEVYNRDYAVRKQAVSIQKVAFTRKALQEALRENLNTVSQKGDFIIEGDTADKCWGRLRTFMDALYEHNGIQFEPSEVITAAVCVVWYAHTDAARIIDIMFRVEKEQPGLPAKEIATLATIQYLSEWVGSMILPTKAEAA
jgi:hypothetical protein